MCKQRNQLRQLVEAHVDTVDYEQMEPYTILALYAKIDGRVYRGHGDAIYGYGANETWQEGTSSPGYLAAYGRAIRHIAEQLIASEIEQEYETQRIASAVAFLRSQGFTTIQ